MVAIIIDDRSSSSSSSAVPSSPPSLRTAASAGAGPSSPAVAGRVKLFALVRILLQYLDRVDEPLAKLARLIIKDCERKQIGNNSKYKSLAAAISCRLRDTVGEAHWENALRIQRRVVINKHRRNVLASLKRESNK